MEIAEEQIRIRVRHDGKLTLRDLLSDRISRSEVIVIFLSLLELTRKKEVVLYQDDEGDALYVVPLETLSEQRGGADGESTAQDI